MKFLWSIILLAVVLARADVVLASETNTHENLRIPPIRSFHLQDLRLRDPYIWPDTNTQTYYLINSIAPRGPHGRPTVVAYTSKNLQLWSGPHIIFEVPENFWAQHGIWAPQLHYYHHHLYLFLTFNTTNPINHPVPNWPPQVQRGSQILIGDSPLGPFMAFTNHPTLPLNRMTLDGTLWIENNTPYMVFSHEWVQTKDGAMEAVQLKDDLSSMLGKPQVLFHASDAPWVRHVGPYAGYVTDAPWLYRTTNGTLLMLWSSFSDQGYAVGMAISKSGRLAGPWKQMPEPFYNHDGGHASLFYRFDGQLMMILHQPNEGPKERARLFEVEDIGNMIKIQQ